MSFRFSQEVADIIRVNAACERRSNTSYIEGLVLGAEIGRKSMEKYFADNPFDEPQCQEDAAK